MGDIPYREPWVCFEASMLSGFVLQSFGTAVYTIVLITIYRFIKDKNTAPFYRVYFYIGVVDVIHSLALIWMNFILSAVHGDLFTIPTYICSVLTCFCYNVNMIGNGLMALNRYSATFNTHAKHFSKFRTNLYLVITFVVAAIGTIPAIIREKTFKFENGDWTYTIEPEFLFKTQRAIILSLMILYFVSATTFTILAYKRISQFIHMDKYHKSDHTLLFFVGAHIFFHFWMLIYEVCELQALESPVWNFFHRYYFVAFYIITVSNGFFIVATTAKVKRAVFKTIKTSFGLGKISTTSQVQQIFSTPVY